MGISLELEKAVGDPVIGVDEAGRGPLAGAVYAAAVSVPVAIAEVIRDLYRNENLAEQSYSERQIYEQALDRLVSEVAVFDNTSIEVANKKLLDILAK